MRQSNVWANVWTAVRAATAVLIVAAIVVQLARSVSRTAARGGDVVTVVANFFSFFTILSNALTAIVLACVAIWFWSRGRRARAEPPGIALALASVTTYMIITGVVYNLLLRGVELPQGSEPVPWSNEVLHVVAPIVLLFDLFVGPRRRALPWSAVFGVIAFPILWVVYTLIRGPLVTNPISGAPFWYPYPFLDPHSAATGGYGGVAAYVAGIAVAIAVAATMVVWWGRRIGTVPAGVSGSSPALSRAE